MILLVSVLTAACLAFGLLPRLLEILTDAKQYEQLTCKGTLANQLHLSELVEAGHSWARSSVTVVEGFVEFDDASSFPFFLRASSHAHPSTVIAVQCDHCDSTESLITGMYVRARGKVGTSGKTVVLQVHSHDDGHDLIDCSRGDSDLLRTSSLKTVSSSGRKLLTKEMLQGWKERLPCSAIKVAHDILGASYSTTNCTEKAPQQLQLSQGPDMAPLEAAGMMTADITIPEAAGPEALLVESGAATTANLTPEEFDVELRLLLEVRGNQCPSEESTALKTGKFNKEMPIPDEAMDLEDPPGKKVYADSPTNEDGVLYTPMKHDLIQQGGKYCAKPEPAMNDVVMGGVIMFKRKNANGDYECHLPPLGANNRPCCQLYAWQPNAKGYYYDNCSMKMNIGADGLWYFRSEVPGNETSAGWGADGFPHIHYDLLCRECVTGDVFNAEEKEWYRFKNKFYAGEVCDLPGCGGGKWPMPGPEHKAYEAMIDGMTLYHYNIIVPDKESD